MYRDMLYQTMVSDPSRAAKYNGKIYAVQACGAVVICTSDYARTAQSFAYIHGAEEPTTKKYHQNKNKKTEPKKR